jgi:hypothetical protein
VVEVVPSKSSKTAAIMKIICGICKKKPDSFILNVVLGINASPSNKFTTVDFPVLDYQTATILKGESSSSESDQTG